MCENEDICEHPASGVEHPKTAAVLKCGSFAKVKCVLKYAIQPFFTLMFSVILVSYRRNTVGMITFNLTFAHNAGMGVFGRQRLPYFKEFL